MLTEQFFKENRQIEVSPSGAITESGMQDLVARELLQNAPLTIENLAWIFEDIGWVDRRSAFERALMQTFHHLYNQSHIFNFAIEDPSRPIQFQDLGYFAMTRQGAKKYGYLNYKKL